MRKVIIVGLFWLIGLVALPSAAVANSAPTDAGKGTPIPNPSQGEPQKITIGEVEDVILVPWAVSLPARIDTGADLSSLDAREVAVRNNLAEFKLASSYGGLPLQLPIVGWRQVRTSMGMEKRLVVKISICLGSKLFRTLATLRDRSEMTYPFLVGRSALNGSFLVDTSRSRAAPPTCPAGSLAANELATAAKD